MVPDVERAATTLLAYCQERDWSGADPYDALNSERVGSWPIIQSRWPRIALTQLLRRSPIDVRAGMRVAPNQDATALALFMSGLLRSPQLTAQDAGTLIETLFGAIVALRSPGTPFWCWGYSFPWQTRSVLVPRHAPNLVATVSVAEALQDLHERRGDATSLAMAMSAASYVRDTLYWRDGTAAGFSYPAPGLRSQIHNANLLGAAFLIRMQAVSGDATFGDVALAVTRSAVQRQRPDGSWPYGEDGTQRWIDSVHAGYNLCALQSIARVTGTTEWDDAIARGLEFYRRHFVEGTGVVRYFHDRDYPIDIQGIAQAILTLLAFKERDPGNVTRARTVSHWAIRHMRDDRGFFYYRRLRFGTIRTSYMRWSQAWMFRALAAMAAA